MRYLKLSPHGIWNFRFQIPISTRHLFSYRTEIKRSLKTTCINQARVEALKLELEIRTRMEENALSEFSSKDAAFIIKATIELYLDRISIALEPLHTDSRFTAQAAEFFLKDEFSSFFSDEQVSELLSPVKSLILDTETPESLALLELTRREGYSYTLNRKKPLYYHALEELTKVFRLVKSAQNAILRADETQCGDILQTLETLKARFESGISGTQSRRHAVSQIDTTINKVEKLTLLDIFEKYKNEKSGSIRDSTLEATKKKLIVISELLNKTSVDSITRDDVLDVKQKLLSLPTNIKKIKEFRNLSYKEAIKKTRDSKKSVYQNQQSKTIWKKHRVSSSTECYISTLLTMHLKRFHLVKRARAVLMIETLSPLRS